MAALGLSSWHMGSSSYSTWDLSSLIRDWIRAPCFRSAESYLLEHQGSPSTVVIKLHIASKLFFKFNQSINLVLAALGLQLLCRAFSSWVEPGLLFLVVFRLLVEVALLFSEHCHEDWWASVVAVHRCVAPWHVGSSWTCNRICVPCIGRWIPNHWTIREVLRLF